MSSIPEVRLSFSYLLYDISKRILAPHYDSPIVTEEKCLEYTEAYKKEWAKIEMQYLAGMTEILGLSFYRSVIDVSLAPFFIPQSDPLILHFNNEPDHFVDVLAHELIHVLLTDNNKIQVNSNSNFNLTEEWTNLFGEHDFKVLVHIPVHAVLKYLYLDVLNEEQRFVRDVEHSKAKSWGEAYTKAWEYVEKEGYKEIIEKLKLSYGAVDA